MYRIHFLILCVFVRTYVCVYFSRRVSPTFFHDDMSTLKSIYLGNSEIMCPATVANIKFPIIKLEPSSMQTFLIPISPPTNFVTPEDTNFTFRSRILDRRSHSKLVLPSIDLPSIALFNTTS